VIDSETDSVSTSHTQPQVLIVLLELAHSTTRVVSIALSETVVLHAHKTRMHVCVQNAIIEKSRTRERQ
jgi:hypothetical protein